ncbi:hypothetical protein ARMSODRAFT_1025122 [Armillaria solidipes]|uniref:Uncharacterized protein n=1 Tax=Armillaria solidipes TaxID=1076256 RepID=A0A2H3AZV2_9AGAR|nr:hypothetical protein ARMSODRAFT_1025122 [Armillaria solidipes]
MDVGSISAQKADSTAVLNPPATNTHEEEDTAIALHSLDLHKKDNDLGSEAEDEDDTPQEQTIANKENTRPSRGQRAPMTQDLGSDAEEAETVLRSIDLGLNFSQCVDKWKEFEMCTTVCEGHLPSSNRPSALSELKKKDLVALPCLSKASQRALIDETLQWWNSIQPESRQSSSPSHAWQLPITDFTGDMGKLRKKGQSGIVQILYLV